jgi:hypothetical protein
VGCFGPACPKSQINKEFRKIRQAVGEIQEAIEGVEPYDTPSTVSIAKIFDEVVPDLLQGMEEHLRIPLSRCGYEKEKDKGVRLIRCRDAYGATDQIGKKILFCEEGTNENWEDTYYGNCLNRCFLEETTKTPKGKNALIFNTSDYRTCVTKCMAVLCIYEIRHEYNFHCCHVKQ